MKDEYQEKLPEFVNFIARGIGIKSHNLCFCGSGKKFKKCCQNKKKDEILWADIEFEKLVKYKNSQENNLIKDIPQGLWNPIYKKSSNRLKCLYTNCNESTTVCHLIPDNILKKNFGGHCVELNTVTKKFETIGIKKAGTKFVFCNQHDNIFNIIDTLEIDWRNKKHLFLLCFKTIPFSLRQTQILLGVDSQLEIYRPKLISNEIKHVTLDFSHLNEQYIRFKSAYGFFREAIKALEKENWKYFQYYHRVINSDQKIFFADWLNPSHDLNGKRLNNLKIPIALTYNVFSKDGKIHILLGLPSGESKKAYTGLLEQIKKVDDDTFRTIINNFIAVSSNSPLLSENSKNIPKYKEMTNARSLLTDSLKRNSNSIFDFTIPRINFLDS